MISPALTIWPPKRLTPSRWAAESRPLRELEAPFLCAIYCLPLLDSGDLEDRQLLTVPLPLVVARLVLELVDPDLGTLGVLEHLTGDSDLLQVLRIGGDVRAVDHQGDGQRDLGAGFDFELLDLDHVSDGDLVLLAAGLDVCVRGVLGCHRSSSVAGARDLSVRSRVLGAVPRRARCRRHQP